MKKNMAPDSTVIALGLSPNQTGASADTLALTVDEVIKLQNDMENVKLALNGLAREFFELQKMICDILASDWKQHA
jgi:hypothetical protein